MLGKNFIHAHIRFPKYLYHFIVASSLQLSVASAQSHGFTPPIPEDMRPHFDLIEFLKPFFYKTLKFIIGIIVIFVLLKIYTHFFDNSASENNFTKMAFILVSFIGVLVTLYMFQNLFL